MRRWLLALVFGLAPPAGFSDAPFASGPLDFVEGLSSLALQPSEAPEGKRLLDEIAKAESEPGHSLKRVTIRVADGRTTIRTEYRLTSEDGHRLRRTESEVEYSRKGRPEDVYRKRSLTIHRGRESWTLFHDSKVAVKMPDVLQDPAYAEILPSMLPAGADPRRMLPVYKLEQAVLNEREYLLVTKQISEEMRSWFLKHGKSFALKAMKQRIEGEKRPPWILRAVTRAILPFVDLRKHITAREEFWIDPHSRTIVRKFEYNDYGDVRATEECMEYVAGQLLPDELFGIPPDYEILTPGNLSEFDRLQSEFRRAERTGPAPASGEAMGSGR